MIIRAQESLWTTPVSRSPDEVLSLASLTVQGLALLHPSLRRWYALPSSPKEECISLDDSSALLFRMEQDVGKDRRRFGDFETLGASLTLANVDNDRDWRKPGLAVLDLNPTTGFNSFSLVRPEPFGEAIPSLMVNALIGLVKTIRPSFACVDVKSRTPEKGLVTYQIDRRLYQHREFFGWMGFVPAQITHAQIRDAHAVHPVDGLGTVIVSVPGVFDPTDDAQVERVHRLERDLASYNLLPVTDPHFKG
ncbi:TPA: immunity 52 family protein [Stenotrophomonas maltophilia]|nr:immunity 52 family protein [Stenotrophomonas maltophilia]